MVLSKPVDDHGTMPMVIVRSCGKGAQYYCVLCDHAALAGDLSGTRIAYSAEPFRWFRWGKISAHWHLI